MNKYEMAYAKAKKELKELTNELKEEYSQKLFNTTWHNVVAQIGENWLTVRLAVEDDERFKKAYSNYENAKSLLLKK